MALQEITGPEFGQTKYIRVGKVSLVQGIEGVCELVSPVGASSNDSRAVWIKANQEFILSRRRIVSLPKQRTCDLLCA